MRYLKALGGLILNGVVHFFVASSKSGLIPGSSILGELIKSITGNLASNHIAELSEVGFEKISTRLKENDPDNVNHDIERLFRKASIIALEYVKALFLQDIDKVERFNRLTREEKKEFVTNLKYFFDENIDQLRKIMSSEEREPLDKALIEDPTDFLNRIVDVIFRTTSVTFDLTTEQSLKKFYADKLPYCFDLAFKEALKHDDVGFKAFQIWILEEIQKQNVNLLSGQQSIAESIDILKNGGNYLNKDELERKWEIIADEIYNTLEAHFDGIKESFNRVTIMIAEKFDEINNLVKDIYVVSVETQEKVQEVHADTQKIIGITTDIKNILQRSPGPIAKCIGIIQFGPQYFIGRDDELKIIREKFLNGNKIIPLSGEGGLGKSSLASAYYDKHSHEYAHVAWVFNKGNMVDSLLSLSESIGLSFGAAMPVSERLDELIRQLTSLPKPCLLVMDNVDSRIDADNSNQLLRKLHNFHILVTTRLKKFGDIDVFEIKGLPKEKGLMLFKRHYKNHLPSEDELFYKLYESIDGNTLVTELLAKNLNTLNFFEVNHTLENLLTELQKKGVLSLTNTTEVSDVDYHAHGGTMRTGTPESIIEAMYEISDLSEQQETVLSVFAILPTESIPYNILQPLLGDAKDIDSTLNTLYQNGWLDFNETSKTFKISPIIQGVLRKKSKDFLQYCTPFIHELSFRLRDSSNKDRQTYLRYGVNVIESLRNMPRYDLHNLSQDEKRMFGILSYNIAEQNRYISNALQTDKFSLMALDYFKEILTDEMIKELKVKNEAKKLSEQEMGLIFYYEYALESAAEAKTTLGFLKDAGELYYKAKSIAQSFKIFSSFEDSNRFYTAYNRYLMKAGRLMEAESYFFSEYKTNKEKYWVLSGIQSEKDLEDFLQKERSEINFDAARQAIEKQKKIVFEWFVSASLDLAKVLRLQGRYEEAIYFHKKHIGLTSEVYNDDPELARAVGWHSMAIALLMEGERLNEAEQLLARALYVYKDYNIAHLFIGQGYASKFLLEIKKNTSLDNCFEFYEHAKKIIEQYLGEDSVDVSEMNINIYQKLKSIQAPDESVQGLKKKFEDILVNTFFTNFNSALDRFGVYHPVLHQGLQLTAQILHDKNQLKDAAFLKHKRQEFIRILNIRTHIRTYDFPSKEITSTDEKLALVRRIKSITSLPMDLSDFELDIVDLPFYKTYKLCRIRFLKTHVKSYKYVLINDNGGVAIDTTNKPIYTVNETDLQLTEESAKYYATFFCDAVIGPHGKFYIMNDHTDIPWQVDVHILDQDKLRFSSAVLPIKCIASDNGDFVLDCSILFRKSVFEGKMKVDKQNAQVDFFADDLILFDATDPGDFVPVKSSDEEAYLKKHGSRKLFQDIMACVDPVY